MIFIYVPFLVCLPVLLVVGAVFVLVPGGFILVLAGAYYTALGALGLAAGAGVKPRQVIRGRQQQTARLSPTGTLPSRHSRPAAAAVTVESTSSTHDASER
jgi:hypothetical protein